MRIVIQRPTEHDAAPVRVRFVTDDGQELFEVGVVGDYAIGILGLRGPIAVSPQSSNQIIVRAKP